MRVLVRMLLVFGIAALAPVESLRGQTDERTTYVTVVDRAGAPVTGLAATEFTVREDDVSREVLRASAATEPLQIALLVDTSQAIEPYVLDLRNALRAFFKQMAGKHEIALIGFGERPTVLVDYTRDVARLEKGLAGVFARSGSGTYLMEAIMNAADGLQRRKANRGTIVTVVARGPEFSEQHHDNVIGRLREAGVALHSMVLTKPGVSATDRNQQELDMSIAEGTRLSGGRREDLLTGMALTDQFQALGNELNSQYQVTYARPRMLIPPKSLEVGVKRPGLTVRARRWP
jgi:Ca-activated chloride channel family protein